MKVTALLLLLAASLAANALLVLKDTPVAAALFGPSQASSLSSEQTPGTLQGQTPRNGAKPGVVVTETGSSSLKPLLWQTGRSETECRDFVSRLKAAGFPPKVIRSVLELMMRNGAESEGGQETRPYWERASRPSKEENAKLLAKRRQQQDLIESLMGEDGKPAALMDAAQKQQMFGGLSDDKINALAKIERDYSDLRNSTYREGSNTPEEYKASQEQRALLDKEKLADLATVLSPAELESYQLRNSETSNKVSRYLSNVAVNEAEFRQLYQMQKNFDETNPGLSGNISGETWAKRQSAMLSYQEQVRATLGEERFYKYAANADSQYAVLSRSLAQYPTVTPAAAYQVYQLQNQLMSDMTVRKQRPDLTSYNARLESLIGAEAAAAYKKSGSGRMFTIPGSPQSTTVIRSSTGG